MQLSDKVDRIEGLHCTIFFLWPLHYLFPFQLTDEIWFLPLAFQLWSWIVFALKRFGLFLQLECGTVYLERFFEILFVLLLFQILNIGDRHLLLKRSPLFLRCSLNVCYLHGRGVIVIFTLYFLWFYVSLDLALQKFWQSLV